jgi:hypothetical protein
MRHCWAYSPLHFGIGLGSSVLKRGVRIQHIRHGDAKGEYRSRVGPASLDGTYLSGVIVRLPLRYGVRVRETPISTTKSSLMTHHRFLELHLRREASDCRDYCRRATNPLVHAE